MRRFIILVAVACIVGLVASSQLSAPDEPPAIELHRTAHGAFFEPAKQRVLFVLIIGSDVREGDPRGGRADSLHVLAVNTRTGSGTLIGIPRDSYVPIPGSGTNKINASLFFGGPQRVVDTVSRFSGIKFDYWALIEFSRFRRLVDALGEVRVNVPYAMADPASGANFKKGPKTMSGAEALAFSRARKSIPGGDFGRSENQGRLLLASLKKFRDDVTDPLKVAKYLHEFNKHVEANVKTKELLDLVRIGRTLDPSKIRNVVIPGSAGMAGAASVVHVGEGAKEMFRKVRDDAKL
jgi:LCP family protein required for cell wall assembly